MPVVYRPGTSNLPIAYPSVKAQNENPYYQLQSVHITHWHDFFLIGQQAPEGRNIYVSCLHWHSMHVKTIEFPPPQWKKLSQRTCDNLRQLGHLPPLVRRTARADTSGCLTPVHDVCD